MYTLYKSKNILYFSNDFPRSNFRNFQEEESGPLAFIKTTDYISLASGPSSFSEKSLRGRKNFGTLKFPKKTGFLFEREKIWAAARVSLDVGVSLPSRNLQKGDA